MPAEYDCPQTGTEDGVAEDVLDTDRDKADDVPDELETDTGADVLDEERLPKVTEPEDPDEESTKPDGIKLCDEESAEAADVVLNKPAGLEAEHVDT